MLCSCSSIVDTKSKITVRIAFHSQEIKAALRLVYQTYRDKGLIDSNPSQMRVTPHHLSRNTEVFIAVHKEKIIGTLSLVRDGQWGLPMESVFYEEVNERRNCGIPCAEVTCLAENQDSINHSLPMVTQLMSIMAQCARYRGIDELLIAVHPKHVRFYERFIGFKRISIGEKNYPMVRDNPAVALALDLPRLSVNHPAAYERYFGVPFSTEDLRYRSISNRLRAELRTKVDPVYLPNFCATANSCPCEYQFSCEDRYHPLDSQVKCA